MVASQSLVNFILGQQIFKTQKDVTADTQMLICFDDKRICHCE